MPQLPDFTQLHLETKPAEPKVPLTERISSNSTHTAFRICEKHFKNKSQPGKFPSLRSPFPVLDLSRPDRQDDDPIWNAGWWSPINDSDARVKVKKGKSREKGERPELDYEDLRRISLADGRTGWVVAEGCILIPQYLDTETQLDLVKSALSEYTLPPNPLSLSTHYDLPTNLFEMYMNNSEELVRPLHEVQRPETPVSTTFSATSTGSSRSRTTIETAPEAVVGYEEILAKNKLARVDEPSEKIKAKTAEELMKEMRWANLGWVYQWSIKAYDFTPDVPIPFPADLRDICTRIVQQIPWNEVFNHGGPEEVSLWKDDYEPDTGIVNFYQQSDTLMGHVDRAELDPSRPLVSLSLGHSCIFLLGSQSRDDLPRPIILRSGDVLIMSGKGRQFYHGVPRILEGILPAAFDIKEGDDQVTATAKRWIQTARININTRQVFPPNFRRHQS